MSARRWLTALLAAAVLAGCAPRGLLYTETVTPLTVNLDATGVDDRTAKSDVRTLQYYVVVQWGGNGIGEIARDKGFKRVYFADLETLSVLGVWTQQWVRIYGERELR